MEPDDIGVVMTRASELHASICDAIDRVSQSKVLGNGLSPLHSFGEDVDLQQEQQAPEDAAGGSCASEEVLSLEGIREALEVLETQLESLQSLQQHQRLRKDAALAALEESRRVLLLRLKEHDGREVEVVEEALGFAGEPVKKMDDLPLPPYLHPVSSPSLYCESPVFRSAQPSVGKQLDVDCGAGFHGRLFLVDEADSDSERAPNASASAGGPEQATGPLLAGGVSRAITGMLGFAGKTLFVVGIGVAFWAVSGVHRADRKPKQELPSLEPKPKPKPKAMPMLECPAGYKRIEDEGIVKCIVKERVELPFPRGLQLPDVLHGRG